MIKVENYPNAYKEVYEILIKLCVLPEQVKTYLERYNVNSKLLKYSPKIYKGLKERISTEKLDKKYLQEKNGVNGGRLWKLWKK